MNSKTAYKTISKHIFLASNAYSTEFDPFVILADNEQEALEIAMKKLQTINRRVVCLHRLKPTENEQVFVTDYVR